MEHDLEMGQERTPSVRDAVLSEEITPKTNRFSLIGTLASDAYASEI